jgi:beta-lactamase class A
MRQNEKEFRINMIAVRDALIIAGIILAMGGVLLAEVTAASGNKAEVLSKKLVEIEARLGGRLGVAVLDTGTGQEWRHRENERFPLNSTFKAFACAGLLARVDAKEETLQRKISFQKSDLVTYSPVTEKHVGAGMTLSELCGAAMTMSDNTAANMVLKNLGGPESFTAFMRSIGDEKTRLDRWETELNEARPGDPRDTTTPAAALKSLQKLVLGKELSETSRNQLERWMIRNKVGGPLLRASLPEDWGIGDRTGAGGHGSRSVVAVIWPPNRKPVVAAIYLTETEASMEERNQAIAEIGSVLVKALTP